jgi:hypothetical protein
MKSSLNVVLAKKNVNPGDALCSEVEGCTLFCRHANENFSHTGIGLLFHEDC